MNKISCLVKSAPVLGEHVYREGNKLADCLANKIFFFADTDRISYLNMNDFPREAKTILNMNKVQVPNLRIRKYHHATYNQHGRQ